VALVPAAVELLRALGTALAGHGRWYLQPRERPILRRRMRDLRALLGTPMNAPVLKNLAAELGHQETKTAADRHDVEFLAPGLSLATHEEIA